MKSKLTRNSMIWHGLTSKALTISYIADEKLLLQDTESRCHRDNMLLDVNLLGRLLRLKWIEQGTADDTKSAVIAYMKSKHHRSLKNLNNFDLFQGFGQEMSGTFTVHILTWCKRQLCSFSISKFVDVCGVSAAVDQASILMDPSLLSLPL